MRTSSTWRDYKLKANAQAYAHAVENRCGREVFKHYKMQLRYHPIMFCDGVRVWPPKWLQTHGRRMAWVSGEVGVLEAVFLSEVQINKVYLQISTEQGNGYLGILPFETAERAKAVFNFLFIHIHDTLEAIGSMDFPDPPAN